MLIKLLIKWGIVQEKTLNLRNNNKLHLHFILSLLNVTKMVLKNRHKFEYPHFTYQTMYNFAQRCMAISSFVREMKVQLAWALFAILELRY